MKKKTDALVAKYDDIQRGLLNQAQRFYNGMIMSVGQRLKPAIVTPGQDVDSPKATMLRGAQAISWWTGEIRKDVLNRIPEAQDILGPPAFALVCGLVLGEICAIADTVGDRVESDVEDTMADVFEGGYILGRVSLTNAVERGAATVEKDEKGVVKVEFGGDGKVVH